MIMWNDYDKIDDKIYYATELYLICILLLYDLWFMIYDLWFMIYDLWSIWNSCDKLYNLSYDWW
jgi:hypothetical protein